LRFALECRRMLMRLFYLGDELLPAVDVVGRAGEGRVGH